MSVDCVIRSHGLRFGKLTCCSSTEMDQSASIMHYRSSLGAATASKRKTAEEPRQNSKMLRTTGPHSRSAKTPAPQPVLRKLRSLTENSHARNPSAVKHRERKIAPSLPVASVKRSPASVTPDGASSPRTADKGKTNASAPRVGGWTKTNRRESNATDAKEHMVERIVDSRVVNPTDGGRPRLEYLIKWVGYGATEARRQLFLPIQHYLRISL